MTPERAELIRRARDGVWSVRDKVQLHEQLADALEASEAEKQRLIDEVRLQSFILWVAHELYGVAEDLGIACDKAESRA